MTPRSEQGRINFLKSSDFKPTGNGAQKLVNKVNFTMPFTVPPTVVVTLEALDLIKTGDTSYWVHTGEITNTGAEIIFEIWSDTNIRGGWLHWYAFSA